MAMLTVTPVEGSEEGNPVNANIFLADCPFTD